MIVLRLIRVARSLVREAVKSYERSPHWSVIRDAWLKTHPICAACAGTSWLQVHHVRPFHLFPSLELDPSNLITLCMGKLECHHRIGHAWDWKAYNSDVRDDAAHVLHLPAKARVPFIETLRAKATSDPRAGRAAKR